MDRGARVEKSINRGGGNVPGVKPSRWHQEEADSQQKTGEQSLGWRANDRNEGENSCPRAGTHRKADSPRSLVPRKHGKTAGIAPGDVNVADEQPPEKGGKNKEETCQPTADARKPGFGQRGFHGKGAPPNASKLSDRGWRRKTWIAIESLPPASVRWSALLGDGGW